MIYSKAFTISYYYILFHNILFTTAFTPIHHGRINKKLLFTSPYSFSSSSPPPPHTTLSSIQRRYYSSSPIKNNNVPKTEINLKNIKPRTGIAQQLLDLALMSPLWKLILVPMARKNIVKTAQANGIKWTDSYQWLMSQNGPWNEHDNTKQDSTKNIESSYFNNNNVEYPEFYTKEFHAYDKGNLCWDAAIEQELASRAVGARNFPQYGSNGEDAFRQSFENALVSLGATVPDNGVIVDLGCGTGTSTRRLATLFPQAKRIIGLDLSPYFIEVGKFLLQTGPKGQDEGGPWVTTIENDERIELSIGNALDTGLPDASVDIVNLSLVIHELPLSATCKVAEEALRILKPNGQLCISEMDFDSPAYAAQRSNAMLFSLLRSTEPYLDEYADGFPDFLNFLVQKFHSVKITAATGRHYALVGTKGDEMGTDKTASLDDKRFDRDGKYIVDDTHLKVWESKQ